MLAGAGAELRGLINVTGARGTFGTGGCGGLVCLDSGRGDLHLTANGSVNADGASPDGGGGQVALIANGDVLVDGSITARGPGGVDPSDDG